MATPSNTPNDWSDCQPGTLTTLGEKLRADERRAKSAQFMRATAAGCILGIVGVSALLWLPANGPMLPGGITCQECQANFAGYAAHLSAGEAMNDALATSMAEHLAGCPKCHAEFEKDFPGVLADLFQQSGRLLAQLDARAGVAWLADLSEATRTVPIRS